MPTGAALSHFVLAAVVDVDVDVAAHDGHGLGAGGTHRHQVGIERLGHGGGDGGRARLVEQLGPVAQP